jgi:hypothetical protein
LPFSQSRAIRHFLNEPIDSAFKVEPYSLQEHAHPDETYLTLASTRHGQLKLARKSQSWTWRETPSREKETYNDFVKGIKSNL